MKMIAGAILILAAAVMYAAYWTGKVLQNPAVVGSPEASLVTWGVVILGGVGLISFAGGFASDRKP